MSTTEHNPFPPIGGPPASHPAVSGSAAARSTIETDVFCSACGFNLHTQPVWKDERLGILIARCPECGQHQPAGIQTTASGTWRSRLALGGLIVWVLLCLAFITAAFFGMFGIHAFAQETLVRVAYVAADGRDVQWHWNITALTAATNPSGVPTPGVSTSGWADMKSEPLAPDVTVFEEHRLPDWWTGKKNPSLYYGNSIPVLPFVIMTLVFATCVLFVATAISVATWFWPAWRRYLWLILPLLVICLVVPMLDTFGYHPYSGTVVLEKAGRRNDLFVLILVAAFEMGLMLFGLMLGRPLARGVLRLVLPPKARQYFSFLWLCDGKTPPLKP